VRSRDAAVLVVVVAAIAVATVVLPSLDDDKPVVAPPPTGEVVEIHPEELDPAPNVTPDPGQPVRLQSGQRLACLFRLNCVMHRVEDVAGTVPEAGAPAPVPTDTVPGELPPAA
jgi:hypothetical protein